MSFEALSREQLLALLEELLLQQERRRQAETRATGEQAHTIAELQLYQVELEIQNRELRRVQLELEEARDRFGELFELAPVAYLALDDVGSITSANHAAVKLLQQDAALLVGQSLWELSGRSEALAALLARGSQGAQRRSAELQLTVADEARDLEVIVAASWEEPSRSTYRCALIDVTARRRAERERDQARASERALHACFEELDRIHLAADHMLASGDRTRVQDLVALFAEAVLQLFDAQEVWVRCEALELHRQASRLGAGQRVTLTQPIDLAGRRIGTLELAVLASAPVLRSQSIADYTKLLELLSERLAIAMEVARLHDAGAQERRRLHWLDRARHLLMAGGEPEEVLAAIARCSDALQEELTIDSAAYVFVEGALQEVAPPRRFGDVLGRWLEREQPQRQQSHAQGGPFGMLLRELGAHRLLVLPLHRRELTLGYLCFALPGRDTLELERTLQEFAFMAAGALDTAQLVQALRGAVDARDTLLALVAHDLRSPLNAISITATTLSEPPAHAERRRSGPQFQLIQRSVQRMSHLIDDLLTAANIDSGTFAIEEQPMSARALALEACALNMPAAEGRGVRLHVTSLDDGEHVRADHERVLQVLTNLIVNALRFSSQGASVEVNVVREGGFVRYAVRDRGPGMTREQSAQVFRRYWRAKGTGGGLGLGLFIAERIVSAHGGQIWVESEPGAGATFYFTLPRAAELLARHSS